MTDAEKDQVSAAICDFINGLPDSMTGEDIYSSAYAVVHGIHKTYGIADHMDKFFAIAAEGAFQNGGST